ncbi:MAG: EAL domain-containing protein [Lachnospiraceae bacterium]
MEEKTGQAMDGFSDEVRKMLEALRVPMAVYAYEDGHTRTILVTDGLVKLTGRPREDLVTGLTESMFRHVHQDDVPRIARIGARFALHEGKYDVVYRTKVNGDPDWHTFHTVGTWQTMEDGRELAFLCYTDLTKSRELIRELNAFDETQEQSAQYKDELTGIPNLNYFYAFASGFRNDLLRRKKTPVLAVILLRKLHEYNALYGFAEGDRVIRQTASILRDVFDGDLVVRGTGDRFLVVCEMKNVETRILKVREKVADEILGDTIRLRAGLCLLAPKLSFSQALDRAVTAAKSLNEGQEKYCCWFDAALEKEQLARSYVLDSFSRAIREKWIQVYVQPIVRAADGRVFHYEALARWADPKYGLLSPGVFVPALEKAHRGSELDFYMLKEVCRIMREMADAGEPPVPVSVNFCAQDIEQENALEKTKEVLAAYHIPIPWIVIEITEREIAADRGLFCDRIRDFRRAGFSIWVDDFGSGYSSLNVLYRFHFDLIKLDMEFTRQLNGGSSAARRIVRGILDCAADLGIHTLAEGVETKEQAEFLREAGCELLQGYYFGKPVPFVPEESKVNAG